MTVLLVVGLAIFSTSCSNKLKPLDQNNFNVTPSPIETVGNKIPVTINGTFPEKWFHKNAIVTITPVLKYGNNQEVMGTPTVFKVKRCSGTGNGTSKPGANVTMNSTFDYVPEMLSSELYLRFDGRVKSKRSNLPDLKVADGLSPPLPGRCENYRSIRLTVSNALSRMSGSQYHVHY